MARNTGPRGRRARRLFVGLSHITEKPSDKDPTVRRPYPPGQHGPTSKTPVTDYGVRLREKQKAKLVYELMERQFARYVERAKSSRTSASTGLAALLESRLDAMVWRAGFATSMRQARQFVRHGYFSVDGNKVSFPRTELKPGNTVTLNERFHQHPLFVDVLGRTSHRKAPNHLDVHSEPFAFKVRSRPSGDELPIPIDFARIIEFYS